MLNPEEEDDFEDESFENSYSNKKGHEKFPLIPRNPQARNRKVSIHDLVDALQRAMATKKRVLAKIKPVKFKMPGKGVDIMEAIQETYQKIIYYAKKDKTSRSKSRFNLFQNLQREEIFFKGYKRKRWDRILIK